MFDLTCNGCGAQVQCPDIPNDRLYSLQNPTFPFVFFCPPGENCQFGSFISFVCCNQLITSPIPSGSTGPQIVLILDALAARCLNLQAACGELPGGPPTDDNPVDYFFNHAQNCTVLCPNGSPFTWTVPAGSVVGITQSAADSAAHALACQQAKSNRVCPPGTAPSLTGYWTLNESGPSANRVDSLNGIVLAPFNPPLGMTSQPGLFGNALAWLEAPGSAGGTSLLDTGDVVSLRLKGSTGFSIFGWFKVLDWPGGGYSVDKFLDFEAGSDPHPFICTMTWKSSTQHVAFQLSDNNSALFNPSDFVPTLGTWYFFHLFYDGTRFGYSINNGSNIYAAGTPNIQSTGTGDLFFEQVWSLPSTTTVSLLVDEIGINSCRVLTAAEVSYQYNSGTGRTVPSAIAGGLETCICPCPSSLSIQNFAALFPGLPSGGGVMPLRLSDCNNTVPYRSPFVDSSFQGGQIEAFALGGGNFGAPFELIVYNVVPLWIGTNPTCPGGVYTQTGGSVIIPTLTVS